MLPKVLVTLPGRLLCNRVPVLFQMTDGVDKPSQSVLHEYGGAERRITRLELRRTEDVWLHAVDLFSQPAAWKNPYEWHHHDKKRPEAWFSPWTCPSDPFSDKKKLIVRHSELWNFVPGYTRQSRWEKTLIFSNAFLKFKIQYQNHTYHPEYNRNSASTGRRVPPIIMLIILPRSILSNPVIHPLI